MIVSSPHDRTETARPRKEIVWTPDGHRTDPLRFQQTLWRPYDFRTIPLRSPYGFDQTVDGSQSKESYEARMNCKHIRHSPQSHMMSKSQTIQSYDDRGKCNPGITFVCVMLITKTYPCNIQRFFKQL